MARSKTVTAYNYIKENIISGEFAPNSNILEESLQKTLGISRTPIREALLKLQTERFIEIYPHKGIVVVPITFELLTEIYELRYVIEPYLFKKACKKLPERWLLKQKDKFLNAPYSIDEVEKYRRYQEALDADFCSVVLQAVGNHFLIESMRLVYDHSRRIVALSQRSPEFFDQDVPAHVAIVEAMLENDEDKVYDLVREHVENNRKNVFTQFIDSYFA